MPGTSLGRRLTVVALLGLLLAAAACAPVQAPKLGEGPPALGLSEVRNLGPAPVRGDVTIAFTTLTGTPAQMRFALEAALKKYAKTRKLTISITDNPTATYRIKGYLSAVGDSTSALLVYVWDVYDTAGHPLHRISGQETAKGSDADPWQGISPDNIDAAARETIDKLADWLNG